MARVQDVNRDELSAEDQPYFDEIVKSRGSIRGPYAILLHSPKLAARIAATGAYVRFESDIPEGLKEVIVLATAREIQSQYVFTAHVRLAREAQVSESAIHAIAQGAASQGLSRDEEMVVRYTRELLRDHRISDAAFTAVKDRFGVQGTMEMTALIGHFLLVANVLAAFDVELAPGMSPELPL